MRDEVKNVRYLAKKLVFGPLPKPYRPPAKNNKFWGYTFWQRYSKKIISPFYFPSPEIIEVKICNRQTDRQILWHHIRVCVCVKFATSLLASLAGGKVLLMFNLINGKQLRTKKTINVLGVLFDSKMQWSNQVSQAISKSKRAFHGIRLVKRYLSVVRRWVFLIRTTPSLVRVGVLFSWDVTSHALHWYESN